MAAIAATAIHAAACSGHADAGNAGPPACVAIGTCADDGGDDAVATDADADSGPPLYPPGSIPPTSSTVTPVPYDVVDAVFSVAQSVIVFASDKPANALHFYSTSLGTEVRTVPLPSAPVGLGLDPAGADVAVTMGDRVIVVDLGSGAQRMCPAPSAYPANYGQILPLNRVTLSAGGAVAYVTPALGYDAQDTLYAIDMSTCANAPAGGVIFKTPDIVTDPAQPYLFLSDSPGSALSRCAVPATVSPFTCETVVSSLDGLCDRLWISADGQRVISQCGGLISAPASASASYVGRVPGVNRIASLSEAPGAQRFAVLETYEGDFGAIVAPRNVDTVVRVYDAALQPTAAYQLPMPGPGQTVPLGGRFVFATPKLETIYVVTDGGLVALVP